LNSLHNITREIESRGSAGRGM